MINLKPGDIIKNKEQPEFTGLVKSVCQFTGVIEIDYTIGTPPELATEEDLILIESTPHQQGHRA